MKNENRAKKELAGGTFRGLMGNNKTTMDSLPVFPMDLKEPLRVMTTRNDADSMITAKDLFRTMVTVRAFEQHLSDGFRNGEIPSEAIHLSIGQEAKPQASA